MTLPALGLFYAGLVQAKNILSVLAQCFAVACRRLGAVVRLRLQPGLFRHRPLDRRSAPRCCWRIWPRGAPHPGLAIPESVYVMFQMTFAVITPALIIGAYVERIRFPGGAADFRRCGC